MNYKEILIESQHSAVTALVEFVLQYHNFNKVIAGFVEGNDSIYYKSRIKDNVDKNNEILFYSCNGRSEVELIKKMIESNLHLKEDVKTLYFCDKDYGLLNENKGIFYTDLYSIENYYATEDFIKNVLDGVFNINKYNPEFNICMNLYKKKYHEFNKQMKKVNAYCYGLRLKEKKDELLRVDLKKIKNNKFILNNNFEDFQMKELDYNSIQTIISNETIISYEEYINSIEKIDATNLRGKWEIKFIEWFFEELKKQIKEGRNGLSKNERNIISFSNEIMTSMERYATTSNKLIDYIKANT